MKGPKTMCCATCDWLDYDTGMHGGGPICALASMDRQDVQSRQPFPAMWLDSHDDGAAVLVVKLTHWCSEFAPRRQDAK